MKIDHSLWKIRRNKMSKKKLLKESTIRRFGGLAGIKPAATSNFLNEFGDPVYMREEEEEFGAEEELEVEEPVGDEGLEVEDEFEDEVELEEPAPEGGADDLVMSLLDKVKEWASEQGVDMDVEGEGAEDMELGGEEDLELDMDMGDEDPDMDMGEEEETLEEMINSVLSEDDEEDDKDGEDSLGQRARQRAAERNDKRTTRQESRRRTKQTKRAKSRGVKVEVLSDEKVIKEVTKRVKNRLLRIAKAQARKR